MSRKRRVFDIDLPDEMETGVVPKNVSDALTNRKGPMASAIAENAEAVKARKSVAEEIREENDALAHEYVALREAGHVVLDVALEDVHTSLLVRDRILKVEDEDLAELVTSVREIGLSNPIRVVSRPNGDGYELVQGYRRLNAYRALQAEEGAGGSWDRIPALVLADAPDTAGLYRRMVDENIIRKDLSFAEMAHITQVYMADPSTEAVDAAGAVKALFQSAAYSKRSYIRSFVYMLDLIGDTLAYPTEIPRALGVSLAKVLKEKPEVAQAIRAELQGRQMWAAGDELEVLRRHVSAEPQTEAPEPLPETRVRKRPDGTTRTTFHINSQAGQVKCTAGEGRLVITAKRDFSSIERTRLEQAIASLIEGLG